MTRRVRIAVATTLAAPLVAALSPAVSWAQAACTAGTVDSYSLLYQVGCTLGDGAVRVSQFNLFDNQRFRSDVTITPFAAVDDTRSVYGFAFNFGNTLQLGAEPLRNQFFEFNFRAEPLAGSIVGTRLTNVVAALAPSPEGGYGRVEGGIGVPYGPEFGAMFICDGSTYPTCRVNSAVDIPPLPGSNRVFVRAYLENGRLGGGSASLASLKAGIVVGPTQVIPEPSTYAFMSAGLAGVLAFTRRKRTA